MQKGYELVKQNWNGRWDSKQRIYSERAYNDWLQWIVVNRNTGNYYVRAVTEYDEPLVDSPTPDPVKDDEEQGMPTREQIVKDDAFALANALATILQNPTNPDRAAVFTLGRRFAKFAGYSDADAALSYIEGFVAGFQNASQPNKQIESGD